MQTVVCNTKVIYHVHPDITLNTSEGRIPQHNRTLSHYASIHNHFLYLFLLIFAFSIRCTIVSLLFFILHTIYSCCAYFGGKKGNGDRAKIELSVQGAATTETITCTQRQ